MTQFDWRNTGWKLAMAGALCIAAGTTASAFEGSADPSFGDAGRVFFYWPTDNANPVHDSAVAVLAANDGGTIVIANVTDASIFYSGANAIGVAKLTVAGGFDAAFGAADTPGQTKLHGGVHYSTSIRANAAALQPDGKIVIVGTTAAGAKQIASVWRLNADGSPDTDFGTAGETDIDRGISDQFDNATSVAIMTGLQNTPLANLQGRIVVGGSRDFNPGLIIAEAWLVALNPDGSLVAAAGGENSYDIGFCSDGRHDFVIAALRYLYDAQSATITLYAGGNCIPRPNTGRIPYPFVLKVDSRLQLVVPWGNTNQEGVAEAYDPGGGYAAYANSTLTAIDATLGGHVAYVGYYNASDGTTPALVGSLNAFGDIDPAIPGGGVDLDAGGYVFAAHAVVVDATPGTYPYKGDIFAGRYATAPCTPGDVCGGRGGPLYAAMTAYGSIQPFCKETAIECFYEPNVSGVADGGVNAMTYTIGRKLLLAGFVGLADGQTYVQVLRLTGDEIFYDGFGFAAQNFR